MNNNYVSGKKATEILGFSRQTLHNYDKNGYIETIRSKGGKRFYNVQKYLEDNGMIQKVENERKICYARVSTYINWKTYKFTIFVFLSYHINRRNTYRNWKIKSQY